MYRSFRAKKKKKFASNFLVTYKLDEEFLFQDIEKKRKKKKKIWSVFVLRVVNSWNEGENNYRTIKDDRWERVVY